MDGNIVDSSKKDSSKKDNNLIDTFQIFEEIFEKEDRSVPSRQEKAAALPAPVSEDQFYEIEYDSGPFPGVGKYVLKSNKIEAPQKDPIRERFDRMRDIAREARTLYFNSSKFYDRRVQQENSRIFYRQGMFMQDFEDDYEKSVPYSAYYPGYQNMGYEQLRTYFTWRTKVRRGDMEGASLSYAFLYIYELLNHIGVKDPEEGLDRLMIFWDAFRVYDATLDKYMPGWVKDYHIYYELPWSFGEFARQNGLMEYYPGLEDAEDRFELLCSLSKYDLRKSVFYAEGNEELLRNGFAYVMQKLEQAFESSHIRLEEFLFQPTKNMSQWIPFKGALFYPHIVQNDRRIVLSKKEIYVCSQNKWTFNTVLTAESGKKLIGYVMKQTEAVLRKAARYKHKLSAGSNMLSPAMAEELEQAGICLESLVTRAALEYDREINKTVVKIDAGALEKIRREAQITQEKLTVPEQEEAGPAGPLITGETAEMSIERGWTGAVSAAEDGDAFMERREKMPDSGKAAASGRVTAEEYASPWERFGKLLSETEFKAVAFLLRKQTGEISFSVHEGNDRTEEAWKAGGQWKSLKQFADDHGIMPEVLADGINEKAMDETGDNLIDDEFRIYDDYAEQIKEMVEEQWQRRYLQG